MSACLIIIQYYGIYKCHFIREFKIKRIRFAYINIYVIFLVIYNINM